MKLQLLIAIGDGGYAEHLSRVLEEKNSDNFEISVCSTPELLAELLKTKKFDAALMDESVAAGVNLSAIRVPFLLWDENSKIDDSLRDIAKVKKYQRISSISSKIMQKLAAVSSSQRRLSDSYANITAVWSPAGGCGKTVVALALAASGAAGGKRAVYLNLEPFSAAPVFFKEPGKSISEVFEKLDGDAELLLQSIRQKDNGSGIYYFGRPQNYDDICVLSEKDVMAIIEGCSADSDELVIDLGSACSNQTKQVLQLANRVFLVSDGSAVCASKIDQFRTQHNVYSGIADKITIVANEGARNVAVEGEKVLSIPKVDSNNPVAVYMTLSHYMK